MKLKRIKNFTDDVLKHHKTGTQRGATTGFKCLDEHLSFKLGYSTYILGFAAAGKTELHFEMLFNLSQKYGWKHGLLSAEIGETRDVIAELVKKYTRKPFFESDRYHVSEKEIYQAINYLDEHFFIAESENDWSINTIYDYFQLVEKENGIKLNTTSIDPWNDLEENLMDFGGREDKYLTFALKYSRQVASRNNWHNFIVTHARDMPPLAMKSISGADIYNTAVPTLQSFAGGQVWGRRAMNVLGLWRPKRGTVNAETGMPFADNEVRLLILKSKPKGSGQEGICSVYWDWKSNRYYEKLDGKDMYAFEHENSKSHLQPNINFYELPENTEPPF